MTSASSSPIPRLSDLDAIDLRVIDPRIEGRIWSRCNKLPGENDCWLWTGLTQSGIPYSIPIDGKWLYLSVRTAVWKLSRNEPIPPNHHPVPQCGQRLCIRPDHLALRSRSFLTRHFAKPRPGEKHSNATMSDALAAHILAEYFESDNDLSTRDLATKYSKSLQTVRKLVAGIRWKHLHKPEYTEKRGRIEARLAQTHRPRKLASQDVTAILRRAEQGESARDLACEFGVTPTYIRCLLRKRGAR